MTADELRERIATIEANIVRYGPAYKRRSRGILAMYRAELAALEAK